MSEKPKKPDAVDVLPPSSGVEPPPLPGKKPGFFRRLFTSRKRQQAMAVQNGYMEIVELVRAMRGHLERQEQVQTTVLGLLEKVPEAMDRSQEVMGLLKEEIKTGAAHNQQLTDSMGKLSETLVSMNESQRASARTVADLIGRSRETEQLLREVMRRSERRVTVLLVLFAALVIGLVVYATRAKRVFSGGGGGGDVAAVEARAVVAAPMEAEGERAVGDGGEGDLQGESARAGGAAVVGLAEEKSVEIAEGEKVGEGSAAVAGADGLSVNTVTDGVEPVVAAAPSVDGGRAADVGRAAAGGGADDVVSAAVVDAALKKLPPPKAD